jgi:hypothetical protein
MLAPLTPERARALLSPSARVLVASADADCGLAHAHTLPWHDVHWPTLLSLTSFERAETQVFRLLSAAPESAVPDDVVKSMQSQYRVAAFRSAEFADAAAAAADAFRDAGIAALWLKGAALAMQSAKGFALRGMGDLDVLVTTSALKAARAALMTAGWTDGGAAESYAGHHHDAPLFWRGGIRLELHTALFPPGNPFPDETAETWIGRGHTVRWGDRPVQVLPVAWHLVHSAVHWAWNHEGAVGTWQFLHDARDLTACLPPGAGVWAEVESHARSISAEVPTGWALWTASRLGHSGGADEALIGRLRGPAPMLRGMLEREWILRAFYSPAASPSVRWSRYWWRRAMRGLGDSTREWPWTAGRAPLSEVEQSVSDRRIASAGEAAAKWRRHLSRVLRG